MGAAQSTDANARSTTILIDEKDVPEAYRRVGVSDDVVDAVARASSSERSKTSATHASEALNREREENRRLREEMHQLAHVQSHKRDAAPLVDTRQELEDKKRIFETTVQRVKSKYFGYRRENVCSDVEQKLVECLRANKNSVLNCKPLQHEYEHCISEARARALSVREGTKKPAATPQQATPPPHTEISASSTPKPIEATSVETKSAAKAKKPIEATTAPEAATAANTQKATAPATMTSAAKATKAVEEQKNAPPQKPRRQLPLNTEW